MSSYQFAVKEQFLVAAGFTVLHRRDACATNRLRIGINRAWVQIGSHGKQRVASISPSLQQKYFPLPGIQDSGTRFPVHLLNFLLGFFQTSTKSHNNPAIMIG
jgi:hypothetical protein